jgi:hypothetical protein
VKEYDKTNPGRSTRAAAADLGISKSAVSKARDQVSTSGQVIGVSGASPDAPETKKIVGRDGKQYPAKGRARRDGEPAATTPSIAAGAPAEIDPHAAHRRLMEVLAEESLVAHWRRCADELGGLLEEVGVERLIKAMSAGLKKALHEQLLKTKPGKPYTRAITLEANSAPNGRDQDSRH